MGAALLLWAPQRPSGGVSSMPRAYLTPVLVDHGPTCYLLPTPPPRPALQVPALVLQSGVLRCRVPPHPPGVVRICLTNGDGRPRSRLHPFEYRDAPESSTSTPNRHVIRQHQQICTVDHCKSGSALLNSTAVVAL